MNINVVKKGGYVKTKHCNGDARVVDVCFNRQVPHKTALIYSGLDVHRSGVDEEQYLISAIIAFYIDCNTYYTLPAI